MKKKNRFFGKTSQKLCVAGFVVCAVIAPVFQVTALQDFMLSDVAMALVGRPLRNPNMWRHIMSASSRFILVCSTIVFGFLYSLATSMRVSGYFRGAAQELADFCHNKDVFCKRNGRILLAVFALTFIGYFALLRSGAGYIDDIARQIVGHFDWMFTLGRVVTELLNLAIHGAYVIHDRSPLGQLIAMGFLSAAALVMAIAFNKLSQRGGVLLNGTTLPPQ